MFDDKSNYKMSLNANNPSDVLFMGVFNAKTQT